MIILNEYMVNYDGTYKKSESPFKAPDQGGVTIPQNDPKS